MICEKPMEWLNPYRLNWITGLPGLKENQSGSICALVFTMPPLYVVVSYESRTRCKIFLYSDIESDSLFFMVYLISAFSIWLPYSSSTKAWLDILMMVFFLIELLILFLFFGIRWKCRIFYLCNLVISFRHWTDVNIGDYLTRRESLQGLLAGGHLEQLPS